MYKNFLDMIDGGGAGRAGQRFEGGGPISAIANALRIRPAGYRDRMQQQRPQMATRGAAPQAAPSYQNYAPPMAAPSYPPYGPPGMDPMMEEEILYGPQNPRRGFEMQPQFDPAIMQQMMASFGPQGAQMWERYTPEQKKMAYDQFVSEFMRRGM